MVVCFARDCSCPTFQISADLGRPTNRVEAFRLPVDYDPSPCHQPATLCNFNRPPGFQPPASGLPSAVSGSPITSYIRPLSINLSLGLTAAIVGGINITLSTMTRS